MSIPYSLTEKQIHNSTIQKYCFKQQLRNCIKVIKLKQKFVQILHMNDYQNISNGPDMPWETPDTF